MKRWGRVWLVWELCVVPEQPSILTQFWPRKLCWCVLCLHRMLLEVLEADLSAEHGVSPLLLKVRSITWKQNITPLPDLQHQQLHFNKIAGDPSHCRLGCRDRTDRWPGDSQEPWSGQAVYGRQNLTWGLSGWPTHHQCATELLVFFFDSNLQFLVRPPQCCQSESFSFEKGPIFAHLN